MYYDCLDGPFNNDGNDKWGEPNDGANGGDIDLLAEVYVGRACVGNVSEVNHFVNKTLLASRQQELSLQEEVLLVGQWLSGPPEEDNKKLLTFGDNYLNELINGSDHNNYTTTGIPNDNNSIYNFSTLYDGDWEENGWPSPLPPFYGGWPKELLIQKINSGVDIINNLGHAGNFVNMKLYYYDVDMLINRKLCFIYSQGCNAGAFDQDPGAPYHDCIAEVFTVKTEHAAYAGIWNAREGFFKQNSTDSPSQAFNRQFWDAVFGEDISVISQANQDSKEDLIHVIHTNIYHRWICYGLNFFGDPTLSFPHRPFHANPHGPYSGLANQTLQFFGSAYSGSSPYKWLWNFGDGTTSIDQRPTHCYKRTGVYPLSLTVKDTRGHEDTTTTNVTIEIMADAHGPYSGSVGTPLQFHGSIQGGTAPYNWTWEFGDGTISYEQNPLHNYSVPISGYDAVVLHVTDAYGDTDSDTAGVTICPIIVYVDYHYNSSTPNYDIDRFKTITNGIANVASGGTVYVYYGTYTEHSLSINKPLSLLAMNQQAPTIRTNEEHSTLLLFAGNVRINGFTVLNTISWRSCIEMHGSNNTITNNTLTSSQGYGISLSYDTSDNRIARNTINYCEGGVYLDFCTRRNVFTENTIRDNEVGVLLLNYQEINLFHHNNFKLNTVHVYEDGESGTSWDNGYPGGGNYWDDFSIIVGTPHDDYQGEQQDIPGSDGIIDLGLPDGGLNPYPVGFGQDRYPFLSQNGWQ